MMIKNTATAMFLLFSLTCSSLTALATGGISNTSKSASRPFDSLAYKQSLETIENKVPLSYNEYVQKYIDIYTTSQKSRFSKVLGLSKYYFPIYEKIFKDRNVPDELKYISVIESSLNPNAVSRVGATGLWQFMYDTGKIYGLVINDLTDERKDPVKACNAAASYLLDSYFMYDDWLLAIASYNCGRNNIRWAIEKAGGKRDFWSIRQFLPIETQNYVPAFIATAYVMNNYSKHNISPSEPGLPLNTDVVSVNTSVSLKDVALAANVSVEQLKALNPSLKKGIVNGSLSIPRDLVIPVTKRLSYNALYEVLNGRRKEGQPGSPANTSYASVAPRPL